MARTLCVWFPEWPLRRPDAPPPDEPCQVVDDQGIVTAANAVATSSGVRPGMRRREAEALSPLVATLIADPGAEAAGFEHVVTAVEDVVPRVEVAHPGLLFVPTAGAVRYHGGEGSVVDLVLDRVSVAAPGGRIGVADGPFAARMAATIAIDEPVVVTDTVAFLGGLDIAVLDVDDLIDTFRWLGIRTLGDLTALPRAAMASRFGAQGIEAHRMASGEERHLQPRDIPEDSAVEEVFAPPINDLDQLAFVARRLASKLLESVRPSGGLPHRVDVEAESATGVVRVRTWRSAHPFSSQELAERVRWQIRAWVESGGIPGGVARLRLAPTDLSDKGRQLRLDEDVSSDLDTRRALSRAQGIVGPDAVLEARPQGGRDSRERVQWHRWGEEPPAPSLDPEAPWPGQLPAPSPVLVPPNPSPLEVEWDGGFPSRIRLGSRWESVLGWAGPWRRTARWWDGQPTVDRYQIITSAGAFLCEVEGGRTFLVGVYD